jgi:hypothetical protein
LASSPSWRARARESCRPRRALSGLGRALTPRRRARRQANPPLGRLALVRSLLPSNPHLGFTKAGFPISCVSLASADLVAMARDLTVDDVVRGLARCHVALSQACA